MRILVACELPDFALDALRSLGSEQRYEPEARGERLRELIEGAGILVVDSRRVAPDVINRGTALQMIVHAGPGAGDIAVDEASAQGIFVTHCPDQHAAAVAELAFGLVLALDRRIVENTLALRAGRWMQGEFRNARGLAGGTLGILGYGPVGREIARRAAAFDMSVLAWSATPVAETGGPPEVTFCGWPREVARGSDVVAVLGLEAPAGQRFLVDAEFLENMRPGAYLVSVGDPAVLDDVTLANAIRSRDLRFAIDVLGPDAGSDVGRFRCRLCDLPGVVATQRIGSLTQQARQATAAEVVRIIRSFLVSGEVCNCLNLAEHSRATWQLVLRLRDAVGVMAAILAAIRADGVNVERIASRVFSGARAAWCTICLDERPSAEALEAIRALPEVLYSELRAVV